VSCSTGCPNKKWPPTAFHHYFHTTGNFDTNFFVAILSSLLHHVMPSSIHKYFGFFYKFHLIMTSHWHCFRKLVSHFLSISMGIQISMLEIFWCHFNKLPLKLQIKTYVLQTWYILCNNVSLITQPKLYFHKPAIVEMLTTNLSGSLFIGTPCSFIHVIKTTANNNTFFWNHDGYFFWNCNAV